MVQHNHWSGKNCPRVIRGRKNGWSDFIGYISNLGAENSSLKKVTLEIEGKSLTVNAIVENGKMYTELRKPFEVAGFKVDWTPEVTKIYR